MGALVFIIHGLWKKEPLSSSKKPIVMKRLVIILLTPLLLFSCGSKEAASPETTTASYDAYDNAAAEKKEEAVTVESPAPPTQTYRDAAVKIPTKIIKTASVEIQVKNTEESHRKIAALLGKYNAYFGSDNRSTSSYRIDNSMSIRVPSAQFDNLLDEVMKEAIYTNYKNISAEDVTDQFVDTEARLKTKKEVEQRYLALLREAKKVQDILDIEDKLRIIREEIEVAEGKLKLMNDQVNYSTINLNTYQNLDYTPEPETGFFSDLKEAFIRGWRGLVDFVVGLVRLWPFLLITTIVAVFAVRKLRKKSS
jgi:hypothetical protein